MPAAWSTLHDIAYLYLFLAANVDGELAEPEVDAIVEVLHRRLPEQALETIQQAVAEAEIERHKPEARPVRHVIEALKYAPLGEVQRGALLNDLLHVARADGRVLPAEKSFINALARAWDVDLPADMGRPVHDLALVYLFMATGPHESLHTPDRDALFEQLGRWDPGLAPETLQMIVRTAARQLQSGHVTKRLDDAIHALKNAFPLTAERRAVLQAVLHIAQADGELNDDELAFFLRLADALGLPEEATGTGG